MTAKTKPNLKAQAQLKARLQRKAGMRLSEEIRQKAELKKLQKIEDALRPNLNLIRWHGRLGRILFGSLYLLISIIFNFLLGLFFYFQDQDFMFDEYEMMRWELFTPLILVMILIIYFQIIVVIQRLHDLDLRGCWSILLYSLWIGSCVFDDLLSDCFKYLELSLLFFLFIIGGNKCKNRFGSRFRDWKDAEFLGWILYWILIPGIIVYYLAT